MAESDTCRSQAPPTNAGLYIHVPFCSSICPYCDFAVTIADEARRAGWREHVGVEARTYAGLGWRFDTVYLGGGTPSILAAGQLAEVLRTLGSTLDIDPSARFFLEVNPEDVSKDSTRAWRDLGFSFVSVGLQSLDPAALVFLGRGHTVDQGRIAVQRLRDTGFPTVSVDVIFGIPGQTAGDLRRALEEVVDLGVDHISCYQLTVHQGTIFGRRRERGELHEAPNEVQAELYALVHTVLADAGFEAYEVSNFARPGHRSSHNLKYWTGVPYLGLGPGAHSFDGEKRRWWNRTKVRLWQRDLAAEVPPVEGEEFLQPRERAFEAVMLGLRCADGFDAGEIERNFGVSILEPNRRAVGEMVEEGSITVDGGVIRPTPRGMAVADSLARRFEILSRVAAPGRPS